MSLCRRKARVQLKSGRPCLLTRDFSWLCTTYTQPLTAVPLGHSTECRNWRSQRWRTKGKSCRNAEVAERAAMVLSISRADIDSIISKERCRPRNPNLPSPGAIPSMPTPSDYSDGEESLLSHPMTPLDRSPEVHRYELPKVIPGRKCLPQPSVRDLLQQAVDKCELLISEGTAQEVPATDKLLADIRATASPTYNPHMPRQTEEEDQALPQSITMEAPPVLQPTPKLHSHATDPVPGPTFTLNSYGKVKLVQSPRSVRPTA